MVMNNNNLSACKLYSLSWSEFSSSLSVAVQNLRNREDMIDVTVSAGGKNFPAHKLVLGAASPLLMDLLKNTTCQHPILMLAGISATDLETILDFVYHGEINVDSEKLPSLLQAAQFLDIRALSPAALVLNSLQPSTPLFPIPSENAHENLPTNDSDNGINKEDKLKISAQKRKRTTKIVENICQKTKNPPNSGGKNVAKISKQSSNCEKNLPVVQNNSIPSNSSESSVQQEGFTAVDEKKIISDLPVNCKLCGVTIRQSRNLRRHIDQIHSKSKVNKTEDLKEKKSTSERKTTLPIALKNDTSNASSLLDFSDDSFNQLTDQIFNYSTSTETISNTNSFPVPLSISSTVPNDNCLIDDDVLHAPESNPTPTSSASTQLYSLSGVVVPQSMSALFSDLCLHLPTTTTMTMTTSTASIGNNKKTTFSDSRSSNGSFDYTSLGDDCCDSGDNAQEIMTFKELDNQLLSACFCAGENDV